MGILHVLLQPGAIPAGGRRPSFAGRARRSNSYVYLRCAFEASCRSFFDVDRHSKALALRN
ncbi:hypothetical protein CALCODRAFT_501042 [Calocera cornea HHB12733]|uniref:Uncharacterized protein n=1 Tax=Calocera cornea HHB12733 TaxID=1353952 RepID=A0A165DTL5_9BASI|nr:hypothetical protein CALCODRAFT_501042 [Calocera cornea HHB12733]